MGVSTPVMVKVNSNNEIVTKVVPVYTSDEVDSEKWDDLTVSANDVTLTGSKQPVWGVLTNDGGGVFEGYSNGFDGGSTDAYGTIPSNANLTFADSFTICFWTIPNASVASQAVLFQKSGEWEIRMAGIRVRFNVNGIGNVQGDMDIGGRNCVVCVYEQFVSGSELRLYVNNELVDTETDASQISDTNQTITMGKRGSGSPRNYYGDIDEIHVYNKALSETEISDYYNDGLGTIVPVDVGALVAGYHLNEGSGTTADNFASTGAVLDMTLTNPIWADGIVAVLLGSKGIPALMFPPGRDTEVAFTKQFKHTYKQGSDKFKKGADFHLQSPLRRID